MMRPLFLWSALAGAAALLFLGAPARAVLFQSMRCSGSPGRYSRRPMNSSESPTEVARVTPPCWKRRAPGRASGGKG